MSSTETDSAIDDLPVEVLQRIFEFLNLESKLSAGLTCRRWFDVLRPVFACLTDVVLVFEDGYCRLSSVVRIQETPGAQESTASKRRRSLIDDGESGSGLLTVNLCACPDHLIEHRHWTEIILLAAGRYVKKLIVEDYLLQKGSFVPGDLLATIVKRCANLAAVELHHVDMTRISDGDLETFRSTDLTELFFEQCAWTSWSEANTNRILKSIVVGSPHLREIHFTACPLLDDRTLRWMAKSCVFLWYVDFSGCRAITARGLAQFFYSIQLRRSDLLYIKIYSTRIDGSELQHMLYRGPIVDFDRSINQSPSEDQWSVCNFMMETGHRACAFQNRYAPGKSIIIFM